ncbi:MAG: dodecin domain-containing protein [Saprospiraceae bacterium]|nr:dodecin domain-containing protein [Saprospiraceae bacterium]MBK7810093.1 dodecin domain-containing protein [Saprospiraceae bacterium]MBK9629697.1 dodecin domain-containing protein [Saprospiraceae bacterium]
MAILKVIEIMASSKSSWEDAAATAVKEASKTIKGIQSVYIKEQSATVNKGKIAEYRVITKISFTVER